MIQVDFLFSNNEKIGSKVISLASGLLIKDLEKVPSHVAVLLDGIFVMESTLEFGVRCIPYSEWKKHNNICYVINMGFQERVDINEKYTNLYGKKYDWFGIMFFAKSFILHYLFNVDFPKVNKWQSKNRFFCTEFAAGLSEYDKHTMTTPAKMCSDLLKNTGDLT